MSLKRCSLSAYRSAVAWMTSVNMLPRQSNASSLGSHLVSFEIKVEKGQDRIQSVYIFRFYTVGE